MIEPVTISDQPPEHPVLDYGGLVAEGIRQLERLSDGRWTDFNAHDPGITILEATCYALTDLGYRIFHEIPDLLAEGGGDPAASLFDPVSALMGRAVTQTDLRKIALDVSGVKNAWVEPVSETGVPLCHDSAAKNLKIAKLPSDPVNAPTVEAVTLAGLHLVSIEKSDQDDVDGSALRRDVTRLLHTNRNLCEDFHEIQVLESLPIVITASVEIAATANAEIVLLEIYRRLVLLCHKFLTGDTDAAPLKCCC